jgi:hypothetical protein
LNTALPLRLKEAPKEADAEMAHAINNTISFFIFVCLGV